ncbi:MAG: hypothetical protein V4538_01600 [Bacteroidota bacterium]
MSTATEYIIIQGEMALFYSTTIGKKTTFFQNINMVFKTRKILVYKNKAQAQKVADKNNAAHNTKFKVVELKHVATKHILIIGLPQSGKSTKALALAQSNCPHNGNVYQVMSPTDSFKSKLAGSTALVIDEIPADAHLTKWIKRAKAIQKTKIILTCQTTCEELNQLIYDKTLLENFEIIECSKHESTEAKAVAAVKRMLQQPPLVGPFKPYPGRTRNH